MSRKRKGKRKVFLIFVSICILVLIAFGSLFLISGVFQSSKYLEPWQKKYYQQFDDARIQLTAHGLLASNGHNMQPWKIKLDEKNKNIFYLFADSDRMVTEVDPFARQLMITQGTFLEYISIAGEQLGYKTEIELFPDGDYDEQRLSESMQQLPVAKISISETKPIDHSLYDYIFLPDTNRGVYLSDKLSSEQINELENIGIDRDVDIKTYQDKTNIDKLKNYLIKGATVEAGVERVMEESEVIFRPNEYQKNKYRFGFSVEGQGMTGMKKHILQGLVTLLPSLNSGQSAANQFIESTRKSVENSSAYTMIITDDNSRISQVKSGMLFSKLVLKAHSLGLVVQPISQVLEEYPEMNELYNAIHQDYATEGGTIQMLVRIGKPSDDAPKSMRQDVENLIIKDEND